MTAPFDPGRIQLVVSRFRELRGLITIQLALFPIAMGAGLFFLSSDRAILWYGGACLVCFVFAMIWLRPRVEKYYTARFGRVSSRFPMPDGILVFQGLTAGGTLRDLHAPQAAVAIVVFALLGGWPAWIVARDWPYRTHWALPVAAAIGAAVPLSAGHVEDDQLWRVAVWWVAVGTSLAVAGWCDHLLLVRTLSPSSQSVEVQRQDPSSRT